MSASTGCSATGSNIRPGSATPISAISAGAERSPLTERCHAYSCHPNRSRPYQAGADRGARPRDLAPAPADPVARMGGMVVDTGAAAHLKSLPRWHPYFQLSVRFDIEPEQEVGPQLRDRGIGARD